YCHTLAEAYILTGNIQYAISCKTILLRFADCYPNWLVHVGYGEYADMDPHIASMNINNLPEPEICPPPNIPDKSLWTGYWSAGRACGVGLESEFVRKWVAAYDLTCSAKDSTGNSIYTNEDQQKIEHDLLLESTILLINDKAINNKSVSNHSAAALVGMCVGNPELVRFGLNSFNKTVDGWYLADGTTSESPIYGLMTLGGIWDMAQAAHGYSDPVGYTDRDGSRIDSLDLYHDTNYRNILDALFKGLQGDLFFPPYADSFRMTSLDVSHLELMVANYPERIQYLSLLKALGGNDFLAHSGSIKNAQPKAVEAKDKSVFFYDLTKPYGFSSFSFYYRKPGLEKKASPELKLPDWVSPELRIGHMRTGNDGRESLLLLSASHWGNHHHIDSLNIYYWKKGTEILSDLGYLWDHPQKHLTTRTVAHNTVVIDEKDQVQKERGGDILFFKTSKWVKAMEVSSNAYQEAKLYRRTSAIIDHGKGRNYVVDFFRVEGGERQDFVFHASNRTCEVQGLELQASVNTKLYDFQNIRSADAETTWRTTWKSGENMNCVAWSVSAKGEHVYVADGWGQRDWQNSDIGATLPYVIRRREGREAKIFISVFEGYEGSEPFVRNVKLIDQKGTIEVETIIGTDYIMSAMDTGTLNIGMGKKSKDISGHFAVVSLQNKIPVWDFLVSGNGT
ncbi:MAG: heparinase II/III family protein, partial [Ginsengibacter sp.]